MFYKGSVAYQVTPLEISIFPVLPDLTRASPIGLSWAPYYLLERNRTWEPSWGRGYCVMPGMFDDPLLNDPTKPCGNTIYPCGAILSAIPVSEMDCIVKSGSDMYYGVNRTWTTYDFTHPSYPDFLMVFGAYVVNQTVNVYPFNDPTDPNAIVYSYVYVIHSSPCREISSFWWI